MFFDILNHTIAKLSNSSKYNLDVRVFFRSMKYWTNKNLCIFLTHRNRRCSWANAWIHSLLNIWFLITGSNSTPWTYSKAYLKRPRWQILVYPDLFTPMHHYQKNPLTMASTMFFYQVLQQDFQFRQYLCKNKNNPCENLVAGWLVAAIFMGFNSSQSTELRKMIEKSSDCIWS